MRLLTPLLSHPSRCSHTQRVCLQLPPALARTGHSCPADLGGACALSAGAHLCRHWRAGPAAQTLHATDGHSPTPEQQPRQAARTHSQRVCACQRHAAAHVCMTIMAAMGEKGDAVCAQVCPHAPAPGRLPGTPAHPHGGDRGSLLCHPLWHPSRRSPSHVARSAEARPSSVAPSSSRQPGPGGTWGWVPAAQVVHREKACPPARGRAGRASLGGHGSPLGWGWQLLCGMAGAWAHHSVPGIHAECSGASCMRSLAAPRAATPEDPGDRLSAWCRWRPRHTVRAEQAAPPIRHED